MVLDLRSKSPIKPLLLIVWLVFLDLDLIDWSAFGYYDRRFKVLRLVLCMINIIMLVYVSPHLVSACYTGGYSTCSPCAKIMLISYKMWEYLVIFGNILSNLR